MKRPLAACAGLFLSASLAAQGSMTTPPGGLTGEGPVYSYLLGIWPDMRVQLIDDMHTDGKPRAITEIAFRLDNRRHDAATATGRTWTNIAVTMAEVTGPMSTSFASNLKTSATRVFDSKWSWSTQTGFPLLRPDVWGGAKAQLRFPFLKPWVHSAKNPIVADYLFRGGTLANNSFWATSTATAFLLDGELVFLTLAPAGVERIPTIPPRCNDSSHRFASGAYTYGTATAYSRNHATHGGKLVLNLSSANTAPNAPVVHALGTGGIPNGLNIGAGCNRLYVDFTKPTALLSFTTVGNGNTSLVTWTRTWRKEFASLDIWMQSAWQDSITKAFKLTAATRLSLPRALPPDTPLRYWTLYNNDNRSSVGFGLSNVSFPYICYKLQ